VESCASASAYRTYEDSLPEAYAYAYVGVGLGWGSKQILQQGEGVIYLMGVCVC
jgi:hypothetical protein